MLEMAILEYAILHCYFRIQCYSNLAVRQFDMLWLCCVCVYDAQPRFPFQHANTRILRDRRLRSTAVT